MTKPLCAIAFAVSLAGCVSSQHADNVDAANAAIAQCRAQTFPNFVERAACMNFAEGKVATTYSHPDLLSLRFATRMAIAEKQDRKQITSAEAELEFARVNTEIAAQEQARANNQQIANAQSNAAAAARMQAANQSFQPPVFRPTFQPQQQYRLQANCRTYSIGNQTYTDCN